MTTVSGGYRNPLPYLIPVLIIILINVSLTNTTTTSRKDEIESLLSETDDPYQDRVVFVRTKDTTTDQEPTIGMESGPTIPRCVRCPSHIIDRLRSPRIFYRGLKWSSTHNGANSTWRSFFHI